METGPESPYPHENLVDEVPTVCGELRSFVEELIRNEPQHSVIGLMLMEGRPVTPSRLAALSGQSVERIQWVLDVLSHDGLAMTLEENGRTKVVLQAPYERNAGVLPVSEVV